MKIIDLGVIEYKEGWDRQKAAWNSVVAGGEDILFLCEHPHVYTLGSHGEKNNLLVNEEFLTQINATYYQSDRGGDITYHGYGQIVAYPIVNLRRLGIGLKEYVNRLEQSVIDVVKDYGVECDRLYGATGVWIGGKSKICAIGVKASKDVTMHGLAFNVKTNLQYFSYINPCGFVDKGVTSLEKEIAGEVIFDNVKKELGDKLTTLLSEK